MKVSTLLPFMDSEDLKELANKILNKEVKGVSIVLLYPFLSNKDFDEVFDILIEKGTKKQLYGVLPFLSQEQIGDLYEKVQKGEVEGFKAEAMIPFLSTEKIKEIFDEVVKNAENEPEDDEDLVSEVFDDEE